MGIVDLLQVVALGADLADAAREIQDHSDCATLKLGNALAAWDVLWEGV